MPSHIFNTSKLYLVLSTPIPIETPVKCSWRLLLRLVLQLVVSIWDSESFELTQWTKLE